LETIGELKTEKFLTKGKKKIVPMSNRKTEVGHASWKQGGGSVRPQMNRYSVGGKKKKKNPLGPNWGNTPVFKVWGKSKKRKFHPQKGVKKQTRPRNNKNMKGESDKKPRFSRGKNGTGGGGCREPAG